MNRLFVGLLAAMAAAAGAPALAQGTAYPSKPVKIIVPWPAGGAADNGARVIANALSARLKQPFVVENRAGANGGIGTDFAARSAPDGYTMLYANTDILAVNPHVYANLRYDALKSFVPVAPVGRVPLGIMVRAGMPAHTLRDVLDAARKQPGKLTYASWGVGSIGHVGSAMLEQSAGVEMLHVPFQGGAPATGAVISGQVDIMINQMAGAVGLRNAGKVKLVAVTSPQRSALFPDLPTVAELGYPDYAAELWSGVFFPKGTPVAFVDRIAQEIADFTGSEAGKAQLKEIAHDSFVGGPAELQATVLSEYERWGKVVRDRKIRADQ